MGNKNYNTVNVEVPVAGEYILTINEHMLIVKCIDDKMKQYSEFIKVDENYIMTSVNFRSGNIVRVMEDFCKAHDCPKRVLRDAMSDAQHEFENRYYNIYYSDLVELKEENNSLKDKLNELDKLANEYKQALIIARDTLDKVRALIMPTEIVEVSNICCEVSNLSENAEQNDKIDETKTVKRKSSNSFIRKSDKATAKTVRKKYDYKSDRKHCNQRITKEDGDIMLEMWKSKTAKDIAEEFPMYNHT